MNWEFISIMYILSTGYSSYIFKPISWLHNSPLELKISYLCIMTYVIISFDYGIILSIYYLVILILSCKYQYKVYSKEIKKITLSSITLCLPLIIYAIINSKQQLKLNWAKPYYISICFQVFMLINLISQNFVKKEEIAYYFFELYKKLNTFKLIFIISNNFLKILEKRIEILIYNWYNRDLMIKKENINNFQQIILCSLQFLIFELYYETIKFSLTVYLKKSKIKIYN
nr:hypothetical protein Y721_p218 [Porphyridium purpureum]BAO23590.1 hypothetical protein [Porphyridium purpureum]